MKLFTRSIICSAAINAFTAMADFIALPMHRRGAGQIITAFCDALSSVLRLPGVCAAHVIRVAGHHETLLSWFIILAMNLIFYFIAFAVLFRLARKPPKAQAGLTGLTRRKLFANAVRGATIAAAATGAYSMFIEPRWFRVTRRTFSMRGLPKPLDGFTILQISDIHHGPWLSIGYVRDIVRAANALRPDLIALVGDYVHRSRIYIEPVVSELAALRASSGVVGVLGNHDWWEDAPLTQRLFARAGIPLIDNTRRIVTPDRKLVARGDEGLCIAGVGDLWEDQQLYDEALGNLPQHMPRVLLAHNPDTGEDSRMLHSGHRVDLMLSGHTHGGQIHIPGLGTPIVPSRFGQKYARGLVQGPAFPVLISHGIGLTVLPLRFGIPPEMILLELKCA